MIHRALLGSIERFFAVLIEHHGGIFPVWMCPVQAIVLPIAEQHHEYAQVVTQTLEQAGLRVEIDASNNTLNKRIRNAQKQKVPFMIILGDKEVEGKEVTVRLRTGENLEDKSLDGFLKFAAEAVELRQKF